MIKGDVPEPKASHSGVSAGSFGPMVCLIVGHTGKMVGVEPNRHRAAWVMYNYHDANDYRIEYVHVGEIPIDDLSIPDRFKKW